MVCLNKCTFKIIIAIDEPFKLNIKLAMIIMYYV